MSCDPAALIDQARCIECAIPPGMQLPVLISLLCQIRDKFAIQSAQFPLSTVTPLNAKFTHGLSAPPAFLRAVLLCTTNDAGSGINAGTEVGLESVFNNGGFQECGYGADGTFIYASSVVGGGMVLISWLGITATITSLNNFSLKLYWHA